MIAETKLAIEDQPKMLINELLEVECRKFYVLLANIEALGHMGSCPGYALLIWQGKATKPRKDEFRERIGRIIERTSAGEARMDRILAGEARMKTCKDRIAERKRLREKRRARIERGAGDAAEEPVNKNDEQVAVRHADASGSYITENQHEEKRMRGIRGNRRGSGATSEERLDEWRKTERIVRETPNTSASSDLCVALEYLVSCEIQSRPGSVLVQKSFARIVTSERCWSGIEEKMPEIRRELRSQEKWTCLNVLEKEIFLK